MTSPLVDGDADGAPAPDAPLVGLVAPEPGRPRLAVRHRPAPGRPFLLVHGLASNARLWDDVARALNAAGHETFAVDLRGHGESEAPDDGGYDTDTCADDLAALIVALGLTGDRTPVMAGQSWGGNVVLSLAARHGGVAAVACVDGGWIRLRDVFADFTRCWAALEPPRLDGLTYADLARRIGAAHPDWPAAGVDATLANLVELPGGGVRARLDRRHHESIVRSLYEGDPTAWYPRVEVPVLLVPALGEHGGHERQLASRTAVLGALAALPAAQVAWYAGADHDLHAQHPRRLAGDLLGLAARAGDPRPAPATEEVRP